VLAYINRGNVYRDIEELDRAAADYGAAIKLDPKDARGWRNRGLPQGARTPARPQARGRGAQAARRVVTPK
jgi:tetratricopeptide (TPR) repeat protein